MFKRPRHATVVAYLALFFAMSGTAWAVTNASSGATRQITVCVARHGGALRILRAGHQCGKAARRLSWNRQGVPGPQGAPGPRGAPGPTGTVDTSGFYTKQQSDARYLPLNGTAANATKATNATNAAELGGSPASAFAPASLFGAPLSTVTGTAGDPDCMIGEVKLFAGDQVPTNYAAADGQTLPIIGNAALFDLIGTRYGGNGTSTFDLPNLAAADPEGDGPAAVNYDICISGIFP
jgi:hypothetical protein